MIDNLTKEQRRVLLMWIIFGVILMGVLGILAGIKINKARKEYQQTVDQNYNKVRDYSRYYTIINILDKYYNTINSNNDTETLKLLSNKYKIDNGINKDNINDKIKHYEKMVTYKGKLMCSKRLGKGFTSYYVSGDVIGSNDLKTYGSEYYDIILNENEMTFSVSVIEASEFGGVCHD